VTPQELAPYLEMFAGMEEAQVRDCLTGHSYLTGPERADIINALLPPLAPYPVVCTPTPTPAPKAPLTLEDLKKIVRENKLFNESPRVIQQLAQIRGVDPELYQEAANAVYDELLDAGLLDEDGDLKSAKSAKPAEAEECDYDNLPTPERERDVWIALDEYPGYVFNQDGQPMTVRAGKGSTRGHVMSLTYRWKKVGGQNFFVIGYRLRIGGKRKWAPLYKIILGRNKAIREAKREDYMDKRAQEMAAALRGEI
jgi:hypothetical protein